MMKIAFEEANTGSFFINASVPVEKNTTGSFSPLLPAGGLDMVIFEKHYVQDNRRTKKQFSGPHTSCISSAQSHK